VGHPSRKPVVRYHSFQYQIVGRDKRNRVVVNKENHNRELFPGVGFIVANMLRLALLEVKFYNARGTAEQWIKEEDEVGKTKLPRHRGQPSEVETFCPGLQLGKLSSLSSPA
jgi:hypothetical protein